MDINTNAATFTSVKRKAVYAVQLRDRDGVWIGQALLDYGKGAHNALVEMGDDAEGYVLSDITATVVKLGNGSSGQKPSF